MKRETPSALITLDAESQAALDNFERSLEAARKQVAAMRQNRTSEDLIRALRNGEMTADAAQMLLAALARAVRSAGVSHRKVAAELEASPSTVLRWMKSAPPPSFWSKADSHLAPADPPTRLSDGLRNGACCD